MSNIILVGFKACGKTTVGSSLAKLLSFDFIDTDKLIMSFFEGKTIKEIYKELGDPHFRKLENEVISSLASCEKCVIATGGGVVLQNENLSQIKEIGKVYYLKVSLNTVLKRINFSAQGIYKNEEEIVENYNKRKKKYEDVADIIVDAENKSIKEVCHLILLNKGEPNG